LKTLSVKVATLAPKYDPDAMPEKILSRQSTEGARDALYGQLSDHRRRNKSKEEFKTESPNQPRMLLRSRVKVLAEPANDEEVFEADETHESMPVSQETSEEDAWWAYGPRC